MLRPLIFYVNPSGTVGDRKPLAILAVIAATCASDTRPVTFAYTKSLHESMRFIKKFAHYILGPNFRRKLHICSLDTPLDEYDAFVDDNSEAKLFHRSLCEKQALIFSAQTDFGDLQCGIFLDFGDSGENNRFTTSFLTKYREIADLGSLFLPSLKGVIWSKHQHEITKLKEFRKVNAHRKIMLLAGSLYPPFFLEDIILWFEQHFVTTEWVFVLSGFKVEPDFRGNSSRTRRNISNKHRLLVDEYLNDGLIIHSIDHYVEYEDIMPYVDFIVTNCGAGSVVAALGAGIPQSCHWATMDGRPPTGSDKKKNFYHLQKYTLGPSNSINLTFKDFMKAVDANFALFKENAQKLKLQFQTESAYRLQKLVDVFWKLQTDHNYQKEVEKTGRLVPVPEETSSHKKFFVLERSEASDY